MEPAEKLRRTNKMLSQVVSFRAIAKTPMNDKRLTAATARIA
jgi:hypothetical protein